jgi:Triose-phosphate Transporter family
MQIQVQRAHGRICWCADARRFLKSASISPPRLHLPCITGRGGGIHKVKQATSDRSLNLSHIPFTSSTLGLRLNLTEEEEDDKEMEIKELDSGSGSIAAATEALTRNSNSMALERISTSTGTSNSMALRLVLMFTSWNLFNIYFNIFNKQVLKVYAFPLTVTALQFGIGAVLVLLMWALNLHKRPRISALSQPQVNCN